MTETYNSVDPYGDGYMEPEEEWEREGLLDPAWEKQQKKVCVIFSQSKVAYKLFLLCRVVVVTVSDPGCVCECASTLWQAFYVVSCIEH